MAWSQTTGSSSWRWAAMKPITDPWGGIDFAPAVTSTGATWSVNSGRPITLWELSTLTSSSAVTPEGRP
jgi:hypothetical protein